MNKHKPNYQTFTSLQDAPSCGFPSSPRARRQAITDLAVACRPRGSCALSPPPSSRFRRRRCLNICPSSPSPSRQRWVDESAACPVPGSDSVGQGPPSHRVPVAAVSAAVVAAVTAAAYSSPQARTDQNLAGRSHRMGRC